MAEGYEIFIEWYHRHELCDKMLNKIEEGWKVLYAVHMHQCPVYTPPNPWNSGNTPTCTNLINPDGSVNSSIFIPIHTPPPEHSTRAHD